MINANELRIGNLVNFPFIGGYVEVIGLAVKDDNKLFIQTRLNNNTFFELPKRYNPIPLTEDSLIRLGFEKTFITKIHLTFSKGTFSLLKRDKHIQIWYENINVQYVHQLQNLYFALTNEELEVKS
jgi:hypothetical protein